MPGDGPSDLGWLSGGPSAATRDRRATRGATTVTTSTLETLPEKKPEQVPVPSSQRYDDSDSDAPRNPVPLSVSSGVSPQPETSAEKLARLATPKVFKGPEVELQKSIVAALEEAIAQARPTGKRQGRYDRDNLYLGSIVLGSIPASEDDDERLVDEAVLVPTDYALDPEDDGSALPGETGMEDAIIANTLRTMMKAGQIDYLRSAGFVGQDWQVLVEIHYYRNRGTTRPNLHKDTLGQTLFVNLNYTNDEEMAGAEFVVNPPTLQSHEDKIDQTLPPQFLDDLRETRTTLPQPTMIETTSLKPHRVLSFVDEAIHHATPLIGGRSVRPRTLRNHLLDDPEYADLADRAFRAWRRLALVPEEPTDSTLPDADVTVAPDAFDDAFAADPPVQRLWQRLVELCHRDLSTNLKRADLETAGLTTEQVSRIFSLIGPEGFRTVSIPGNARTHGTGRTPVGPEDGAPLPLQRRMSLLDAEGNLPDVTPPDAPRRFFRTWVRAVRGYEVTTKKKATTSKKGSDKKCTIM